MPDFKLTTPVVFIIFNRPDTASHVFAEIAKVKPPKLLVIADGPRSDRFDEKEKCKLTRAIIEQVNWPCEVLKNYSEINLGCKNRVSSGLDWVFEKVSQAIILEDDCLPNESFFRFCEEMLKKYRNDMRVGMISGDNFQFGRKYDDASYYFSKYFHIWGWATWRTRWQGTYDVEMKKWPIVTKDRRFKHLLGSKSERKYWSSIFKKVYYNKIDTWDYQWVFANWLKGRLSIVPSQNLISNIGFGRPDATHTVVDGIEANIPTQCLSFPLKDPKLFLAHETADNFEYKKLIKKSIYRRIYMKLAHQIKKVIV